MGRGKRKLAHRIRTIFFFQSKFLLYPDGSLPSNEEMESARLQEFASLGGDGLVNSLPAPPMQKMKIELKATPISASGSGARAFALSYCRTGLSPVTILFKSNLPSLHANISSNHNILSPFLIKDGASLFGRTDRFSSSFV